MSSTNLQRLRKLLEKHDIGYYLVLTQDDHDSEYVAAADKRRAFISGFTGSAGVAIIGRNSAELSTDGRYYLQAEKQLSKDWYLRKEGSAGVVPWYKAVAQAAKRDKLDIGVDAKFINFNMTSKILAELKGSSVKLRAIPENLVDEVWDDKPKEPSCPVEALALELTGRSFSDKLADIRTILKQKNVKSIVLSALDEIAWFFNLRGKDIEYNPVFKAYALVSDTQVNLYVDDSKFSEETRSTLGDVVFKPYDDVFQDSRALAQAVSETSSDSAKLWVPKSSSWALVEALGGEDKVILDDSPVQAAKAVKNATEIEGAKKAHVKCGLSIVRFFSWIDRELKAGNSTISEYDGSMKLLEIRKELDDFVGPSFESISSVGANAAVIHYAPSPEGTQKYISRDEVYLLDSGCQFTHGTTDTTRTMHFGTPSEQERTAYTLVLKGHLALATVVFPEGVNGYQLDVMARQHLWKEGLDYRHGTGHGIGAYLNVHEGPMGISSSIATAAVPLAQGHYVSNEPGYYEDGKFGIRIESDQFVVEANTKHRFAGKRYLTFENVTLVPLALNLMDKNLLSKEEIEYINSYHDTVREKLSSFLSQQDREWLEKATQHL